MKNEKLEYKVRTRQSPYTIWGCPWDPGRLTSRGSAEGQLENDRHDPQRLVLFRLMRYRTRRGACFLSAWHKNGIGWSEKRMKRKWSNGRWPMPNQSINQSTNQPTNQPINRSIDQSTNQPTNQSINQSINQQISWIEESIDWIKSS